MNSAAKYPSSALSATIIFIAAVCAISACSTTQPPKPVVEYKTVVVDTGCTWTKIITVGKDDVLSDDTAKQILAHDRAWVKNCRDRKGEK